MLTPNSVSGGQLYRSAGVLAPDIDINGLLCNLNSAFNPLHRDCLLDYHVDMVDRQRVCLSVIMPRDALRSFTLLLESMGGFFRVVNNKARSAHAIYKVHDIDGVTARKQLASERERLVCSVFDSFREQGHSTQESIKRTNFALKSGNGSWSSRYIVEKMLRVSGRLRQSKRRKEGEAADSAPV